MEQLYVHQRKAVVEFARNGIFMRDPKCL